MKKIIYSFWATATAFGLVGACGGDSSDPAATTNNTTSPTTTTTSPTTTTTTTSPTTVTGTGGMSSTGTSTTGIVPTCTTVTHDMGLAPDVAQVPAAQGVYSYGDGVTTACLTSPAANQVCLEGLGALAGEMYENYGAGIGIQLAVTDPAEVGWDATADGVVGVKFNIAGTSASAPVRVGVTVVGLTDNGYTDNPDGITTDGALTVNFADLVQPPWSEATVTAPFDPTNIHSLQFQLVTEQDATRPYSFCVTGITWIDANGMPVDLPWGTGGGEGGAGGEGGGAGAAP